MNWLNKNLKIHIVWYLEKERRSDIETWSFEKVLNKEQFYGKSVCRICAPKALVKSPKEPIHARKSFEDKIFWKMIIKKPYRSWLNFFLCTQSLFMNKIMKNKSSLELVTSLSLGCKPCLEKFLFSDLSPGQFFDDLIQRGFWVILKIAIVNLCKPIHDIIIPASSHPRNLETDVERKKIINIEYLENKNRFWNEIKVFFIIFEMFSYGKI